MTSHEIDALFRLPFPVGIEVWTSQQPRRQSRHQPVVAAQEPPHVVTKLAIPFAPGVTHETAHLIQPARVPRLGDELCSGKMGVGFDVPEDRRVRQGTPALVAGKNRGEVEAKTVYVHLCHPIPQTVHDQPSNDGMIGAIVGARHGHGMAIGNGWL